jgi:hypothetical protein
MHMPRGLQKPHHIAEIIPPLLALAIVAWASIAAIAHIVQTTAL